MAGETAFLVFDTESVPDGRLLARVKYPGEGLTPEAAVERAQTDARAASKSGSDFLPVPFHVPVAVAIVSVGPDFELQKVTRLDAPSFRTRNIVADFWAGVNHHQRTSRAKLVTFNGRKFDLPLMELAALRFGLTAVDYCGSRDRFRGSSFDVYDWLTNFGALYGQDCGLDLFAKLLGKPGKMGLSGDQVYAYHQQGRLNEINDYCLCDALDTYFVFLRAKVFAGELSAQWETEVIARARGYLESRVAELPVLGEYLSHWHDVSEV